MKRIKRVRKINWKNVMLLIVLVIGAIMLAKNFVTVVFTNYDFSELAKISVTTMFGLNVVTGIIEHFENYLEERF